MDGLNDIEVMIKIDTEEEILATIKKELDNLSGYLSELSEFELDPTGWSGTFVNEFNKKIVEYKNKLKKSYNSLEKTYKMIDLAINDYKTKLDVVKVLK